MDLVVIGSFVVSLSIFLYLRSIRRAKVATVHILPEVRYPPAGYHPPLPPSVEPTPTAAIKKSFNPLKIAILLVLLIILTTFILPDPHRQRVQSQFLLHLLAPVYTLMEVIRAQLPTY
jgi:hypothetical protein